MRVSVLAGAVHPAGEAAEGKEVGPVAAVQRARGEQEQNRNPLVYASYLPFLLFI